MSDKSYSVKKARELWMIFELNRYRYTNCEDDFSLQQVSIVSRVSMVIPFHAHQQISITRIQVSVV